MPTYEYKMFPPTYHVLDILAATTSKEENAALRFLWVVRRSSEAIRRVRHAMKLECVAEAIEFQGSPTQEDKDKAFARAKELARIIKAM